MVTSGLSDDGVDPICRCVLSQSAATSSKLPDPLTKQHNHDDDDDDYDDDDGDGDDDDADDDNHTNTLHHITLHSIAIVTSYLHHNSLIYRKFIVQYGPTEVQKQTLQDNKIDLPFSRFQVLAQAKI